MIRAQKGHCWLSRICLKSTVIAHSPCMGALSLEVLFRFAGGHKPIVTEWGAATGWGCERLRRL